MIISGLNNANYYNNCYRPAFKGNYRTVLKESGGEIAYKTFTFSFRPDFDWNNFTEFLSKKYKNVKKVNFIDHACSSGEETFSIASKLLEDLGISSSKKFFPIIARDFDKENIEAAKSGVIGDVTDEKSFICNNLKKPRKYYKFVSSGLTESINPKRILTKNIQFEVSDIFNDVNKLPEKNTVLLCRNLWLWLNPEQRENLVAKIAEKFKDDSSILAIGDADMTATDIHDVLYKYGFKRTGLKNTYCKA